MCLIRPGVSRLELRYDMQTHPPPPADVRGAISDAKSSTVRRPAAPQLPCAEDGTFASGGEHLNVPKATSARSAAKHVLTPLTFAARSRSYFRPARHIGGHVCLPA